MDFGSIIKRSWTITWRYKALWVLGIFAGVSGCSGSSSGSSGGGNNSRFSGSNAAEFRDVWEQVQGYVPLILGFLVLMFFLGLVWSVFAIAARGGLVSGVNSIEEGSPRRLGELWHAGFARFWSLLGLELLLKLPMFVLVLVMMAAILIPILGPVLAGQDPSSAVIAPICGSLAIGVPLLIIGGFILGIMQLIALRYVMLGGQGALDGARNSWHFLRARFKDTFLMWLISVALNIAASFVLAIPAIAIGVGVAVPLAVAARGEQWGALAAGIPIAILLFAILGLAYSAIWGTFTSSLWTLFFRNVTGMAVPATVAPAAPTMPQPPASQYAYAPQPPVAPDAYAPQPPAPPIADYAAAPEPTVPAAPEPPAEQEVSPSDG